MIKQKKQMIKKLFFSFSIASSVLHSFAQQDPGFSQNMFLKLPVNAGYAGTNGALCATAVYRDQWVGLQGAPKTFLFCADALMPSLHGGVGFTAMNDKIGNFNFTNVRGAYSVHKQVGQTGLLGAGIEAGIIHLHSEAFDSTFYAFSGTTFDLGLGIYYRTEQFYTGLSVAHLPGKQEHILGSFDYQVARHYYFMAGYELFFSSWGSVIPSVHVKSDDVVTTVDLNLMVLWKQLIWVGFSYRYQNAIVPMAGFKLAMGPSSVLKIGYSYDLATTDFKNYPTHEFLLNYCIKLKTKTK